MRQPTNSGQWTKAIDNALRAGLIKDHHALTAFRLATVINWRPTEPQRRGRPALYWQNRAAAEYLGIAFRSFERHRSALREAGLIGNQVIAGRNNLVPLLPTVTDDADTGDGVTDDGPYEENYSRKNPSRGSSSEVESAPVMADGGLVGASASGPKVAWATTPVGDGSSRGSGSPDSRI